MSDPNPHHPLPLAVLYDDEDGAAGLFDRRVLIQVRRGTMRARHLDAIERAIHEALALKDLGYLAILESTASIQDSSLRDRQRAIFKLAAKRDDLAMGFCVLGGDLKTTLLRSMVRLIAVGLPQGEHLPTPDEAARFVGLRARCDAVGLRDAVRTLRKA